jgi:alanine racemase
MSEVFFQSQHAAADIRRRIDGFTSWLEIDLDCLGFNLHNIRQRVGVEIMPVVKNNAYGHGLLPIVAYLISQQIRWVMVAKLYEAEWIKQARFDCQVVNMDALFTDEQFHSVVEHGITQVVYTMPVAERLNAVAGLLGQTAPVFIKIDTGLNRVGVRYDQAVAFIEQVAQLPHVKIAGIFSTLMQQPEQDARMLERFRDVDTALARKGIAVGMRSVASSHAILHDFGCWFDMVRPAMSLFGIYPEPQDRATGLELKQALVLKARIEYVKWLEAGESVTYFGRFIAPQRMRVGTLHLGFYDGIPREMANKARILVDGVFKSSLGTVSLNHLLVDLTDVNADVGDVVTVIGREATHDLSTTAETAGWMVYSLLNHLHPFTPRVYYRHGEPVALLDLSRSYGAASTANAAFRS